MAEFKGTMYIVEIPYENGQVRFRYERYLSHDGTKWIRHGLFQAYHPNGQLASEGLYEQGLETGMWHDFHENGQLAAEGHYEGGRRTGVWRFYDNEGRSESEEGRRTGSERFSD
jgi:antitoxin component YwqK of YwqJK toxin-antitoxin module